MPDNATTPLNAKDRPIILASSSQYRKALLTRLGMPFICTSPNIDETPIQDEDIERLVIRLARQKAQKAGEQYHSGLIIGSDQAAVLTNSQGNDVILGKPGNKTNAINQLTASSGRSVTFKTGLCVLDIETQQKVTCCEDFTVNFRTLTSQQIEQYVEKEQPYDCAGSFKSEGMGIRLFESMQGRDPTALIGLPLIALTDCFLKFGVDPLG